MRPYLEQRFSYEFLHIAPSTHLNYYLDYSTTFAKLSLQLARRNPDAVLVWNNYYLPILFAFDGFKRIVDVTDVERSITHNRLVKGLLVDLVDRGLIQRMDLVICADYGSYLGLRPTLGRHVRYVPNGVDLKLFSPDPPVPKDHDACYLGKIEKQYNLEAVISGVARGGFTALFIGRGKDLDYYEQYAKRTGANIEFYGYAEYEDVPALLRRCRMGLVPPVQSSSLKLLEYLACGLPVASPGVLDPKLLDGVIPIKQGREAEYADAIGRVVSLDRVMYHELSRRCREASRQFSVERVGQMYCDVIEEALKGD